MNTTEHHFSRDCSALQPRASRRHRRARTQRRATTIPISVLIAATIAIGSGTAAAEPQPGVTDPSTSENQPGTSGAQQPGTTTPAAPPTPPPAPTPPPRPQEQSWQGNLLPEPQYVPPEQYRPAPSAPSYYSNPGNDYNVPQYDDGYSGPSYSAPQNTAPDTSLGEDLGSLHLPQPVEPPKVIVPPDPEWLGVGDAKIARPVWVPVDAAWKLNAQAALAQRDVDHFLTSIGFDPNRSTRMGTGMVVGVATGATIGFVVLGAPAAVVGGVGGALIGGTIGGVVGAGLGTLVPVPVLGTITSGVAGTAIGAAAGAAIGATVIGVPAALLGAAVGGAIGGTIGTIVTAGDGSDFTPPPETPPAPPAPAPTIEEQVDAAVDSTIAAGEQAVDWVEAQPGGQQVIDTALEVGAEVTTTVQQQPWAEQAGAVVTQAAQDFVEVAATTPETAQVTEAVVDAIVEQPQFAPDQFGAFTDAANGALAAVQSTLR